MQKGYAETVREALGKFDVDPLDVAVSFDISYERGEFIFCVHKSENAEGKLIEFPKDELIELSKK